MHNPIVMLMVQWQALCQCKNTDILSFYIHKLQKICQN